MKTDSETYLTNLHKLLAEHFNLEEIRTLCFNLHIDYESVPGAEKSSIIRELLLGLGRNGRLPKLINLLQQERPNVDWPSVPDDFKLPELLAAGEAVMPTNQYHVYGDVVQGDKIGGDKVAGNKYVYIYPAPNKSAKPHLPYEPDTIVVPAGTFSMGLADDPLASPLHIVDLVSYRIGLYPVTNEQFGQFIRQTGRLASSNLLWHGNQPPHDKLRHPVAGVTWQEALAYCGWLQELTERPYTLPNEAQWEKAARGVDGRLYPWGNEWEANRCNDNPNILMAVDAFPCQSPYGCYDMVGNAREWTTTHWGGSPNEPDARYRYPWINDSRDDLNAPPTTRRVFRGGRGNTPIDYRCSIRNSFDPKRAGPRSNRIGFRVVLKIV